MRTDATLDVLLVEDNPGDARYIHEILREATELTERTGRSREDAFGEARDGASGKARDGASRETRDGASGETRDGASGEARDGASDDQPFYRGETTPDLRHETRLADGLDALDETGPDIVLLDLGLPDSRGLETLERVLERAETVPVVVLTGLSDREVGLEAFRRGAEEYLVKDEITADLLIRSIYHAIERKAHERRLEAQRERLRALNQLHGVVQGITDAVIEQSTREEIEETVCEQLAAAASYELAWIGEVDSVTDTVAVRTKAGDTGYLDDVTVSLDPDDERSQGPAARAIRTGETQVQSNMSEDPAFEPWREQAARYGYRSGAAIPVVHEGTLYGVLCVYAARPDGFAGAEREVLGRLGEVVGHAIAAVERKRTLMSDEVVEVDVGVPDVRPPADADVALSDRITLDRAVPVDDEYRMYGSALAADVPVVEALAAALDHWASVDVVSGDAEDGERVTFELAVTGEPVLTTIAAQGGDVREAIVGEDGLRVRAQFPHDVAVRQVLESVQSVFPTAEVQAQRLVERSEDWSERVRSAFEESLTERQRAILETAYFRGYFEWPRESSGEEIADSVGLSPPTFSEHLRGAENRVFEALFEDD